MIFYGNFLLQKNIIVCFVELQVKLFREPFTNAQSFRLKFILNKKKIFPR